MNALHPGCRTTSAQHPRAWHRCHGALLFGIGDLFTDHQSAEFSAEFGSVGAFAVREHDPDDLVHEGVVTPHDKWSYGHPESFEAQPPGQKVSKKRARLERLYLDNPHGDTPSSIEAL